MKPEEQRIAIAEACGWKIYPDPYRTWWKNGMKLVQELPNYLSDLNAMHEAEKMLASKEQQADFSRHLVEILNRDMRGTLRFIGPSSFDQSHATTAQRAEAFLRTLNLWKE